MVTGPSLINDTFISAPNCPVFTGMGSACISSIRFVLGLTPQETLQTFRIKGSQFRVLMHGYTMDDSPF